MFYLSPWVASLATSLFISTDIISTEQAIDGGKRNMGGVDPTDLLACISTVDISVQRQEEEEEEEEEG